MATGDITAQAILVNGRQIQFDIAGLDSAQLSGFETGLAPTVDVTREKYTSTVLGTQAVTGITCRFVSVVSTATGDFLDEFTGVGGTDLTAHTPDDDVSGNGWTNQLGNWEIASSGALSGLGACAQALATDGTSTVAITTCDVSDANAIISLSSVIRHTGRGNGIIFRYVDANNYWRAVITDSGDRLEVTRRLAGVSSFIGGFYSIPSYSNSTLHTLTVDLTGGNSVVVKLDGVSRITFTDASHNTSTKHGLWTNDTNTLGQIGSFTVNLTGLGARVLCDLSQPIHNDDTLVKLQVPSGTFDDGTNANAVLTNGAATNNSTHDYNPPAGGLIGVFESGSVTDTLVHKSVVAGTITAEAQFAHWTGIAAVKFTASDGVNPDVTSTVTARTRSLHHDDKLVSTDVFNSIGGRFYYRASLNLASLNDGAVTLTAAAYPVYGDVDAIRSAVWTLYNNSGGAVATAMDAASATGGWDWAADATHGGAAGTPPTYYIASTGNDTTGNGTSGTPYLTLKKAMDTIILANVESWTTVVIKDEAVFTLADANTMSGDAWVRVRGAVGLNFANVILRTTTAALAPRFVKSHRVRLNDLTVDLVHGSLSAFVWAARGTTVTCSRGAWHGREPLGNYVDATKVWTLDVSGSEVAGASGILGNMTVSAGRGLNLTTAYVQAGGTGNATVPGDYTIASYNVAAGTITFSASITGGAGNSTGVRVGAGNDLVVSSGDELYVTDCVFRDRAGGPQQALLSRNVSGDYIVADWCQNPVLIIANKVTNFNGLHDGNYHSDGLQPIGAITNMLADGFLFQATVATQVMFFENSASTMGGNGRHDNWAVLNCVLDLTSEAFDSTVGQQAQFCRECYNVVIAHNSFIGANVLHRGTGNDEEFRPIGARITNNIYSELSEDASLTFLGGIHGNHYIAGSASTNDSAAMTGGTEAGFGFDRVALDYQPSGPVDLSRPASDVIVEGDLYGYARAAGAVTAGALEATPITMSRFIAAWFFMHDE